MKILFIINSAILQQNNDLYIFKADGQTISDLKESGIQVELFQRKAISNNNSISSFNLTENGLKVTTAKLFYPNILNYIYSYIIGIWRIFHNDFVYIYYPNNFKWLGLIAKLLGKEFGLSLRGCQGIYSKSSKFLYKHAKVVLCVSPEFTKMVNSAGGNGFDTKSTIAYSNTDIVSVRKYKVKEKYNLLYLGRMDLDKGLIELLIATQIITNNGKKIKLDFVGGGPALAMLKAKAEELDLMDSVIFHGAIMDKNKIKQIYLDSDIYILPTYHEGFPRTLLEAMLFGTPIITTFVGGIPGFMKENINALRIEPKSVSSIVEKLTYGIENYESLVGLALNGTKTAEEILASGIPSEGKQLAHILKEFYNVE